MSNDEPPPQPTENPEGPQDSPKEPQAEPDKVEDAPTNPPEPVPEGVKTTLHIGNLAGSTTDDDLRQLFSPYGTITSIRIPRNRDTGQIRGFGFVELSSEEIALKAISNLNNTTVDGHTIIVELSKSRPKPRGFVRERRRYDDDRYERYDRLEREYDQRSDDYHGHDDRYERDYDRGRYDDYDRRPDSRYEDRPRKYKYSED